MYSAGLIARHLALAPGAEALRSIAAAEADAPVADVLTSAMRFADAHLAELNRIGDREGCRLEDGRVITPAAHKPAWAAYCDDGWLTIDAAPASGGMGLPTALAMAVQEAMDRACPAFGMMPVSIRAGLRLLDTFGDDTTKAEWLPRLISGDWGATICISEPDAGSDVQRIRTRATRAADGGWSVTGEKCWISFGDQDLTARIGHFLLAKTGDAAGDDRISLFLVPDRFEGDRNGIAVRRIEEKLGLHLSPTCALGFEGARAILLGEQGRGLRQLFVMIRQMRLATGVMGLAIAGRAFDVALAYARERRQGGDGPMPVAIAEHADVQRMLLDMAGRVEVLRGLIFATANQFDLASGAADAAMRDDAAALAGWLLPIVKTLGGETGFAVASEAIQILGGAGYTRAWPVEQGLRDARVLTIFEGTTGLQAQDLLFRRLLADGGRGLRVFLVQARRDAGSCAALAACLDELETVADLLAAPGRSRRDLEAGATAFLGIAGLAASAWIAARLAAGTGSDPLSRHLVLVGSFALEDIGRRSRAVASAATTGADALADFGELL
jgi:alkylation response protein AidB-like acyl-CoA dehydrogenase